MAGSINELYSKFELLSLDDQYAFICHQVIKQNGYLQWRLKNLLNSFDTPDLFSLLPYEIQDQILVSVDGISLLNACQVSKSWNELITRREAIWKAKCFIIGVNLKKKPRELSWYKAYLLSLKQLQRLKHGVAFRNSYCHLQNAKGSIKAVDYSNGYLCSVSDEDIVNVWHLELNISVGSFYAEESVSCIRFRGSNSLVCGHFTGSLTLWDLSGASIYGENDSLNPFPVSLNNPFLPPQIQGGLDQSELRKFRFIGHSGPVFTCDFDGRLNILVSGSADEKIKLWDMQKGVLLHSIDTQSHWVLKVILIPPSSDKSFQFSLIAMSRDSVDRYIGLSNDLETLKRTSRTPLNETNDNFITPGLHINSDHVCLIKQDLQQKQAILQLLCLDSFKVARSLSLNFKVRKLLAIGNRFALCLTVGKELFTSTLIVFDLVTEEIVGSHPIPHSKMTTPNAAQMIVGETEWLDGLQGWSFIAEASEVDDQRHLITVSESQSQCSGVSESESECSGLCVSKNQGSRVSKTESQGSGVSDYDSLCSGVSETKNQCSGLCVSKIQCSGVSKTENQCSGVSESESLCSGVSRSPISSRDISRYLNNSTKSQKLCFNSFVFAVGVPTEEGQLFTIWWNNSNDVLKKKVD